MYLDFHAHILPGADHGSDSLETSLMQLQKARHANISMIVATPHFYIQNDSVETFLKRREMCYNTLINAADENIKIIKAAEVTLSYDLPLMPDLDKLCIEGTNYILLEMPDYKWSNWVIDALYKIISLRHLNPIIAHIDRYDFEHSLQLMQLDILFQINASALLPIFGRRKYLELIDSGRIRLLGSDVHSTAKEYDDFSKAVKLLKKNIASMMQTAEAVLSGKPL